MNELTNKNAPGKTRAPGLLLVILSGATFGVMPALVTFCYRQGATPMLVLLFRFSALSLAVLPWARRDGGLGRALRLNWKLLLPIGLAGGLTPLLLYTAYQSLSTGLTMTLHFLYPTLVMLWCVLVYRERLSGGKLLCLAFSVGGILLTLDLSDRRMSLLGVALALLSGLTYAAYIVWMKKLPLREITTFQLAFFVGLGCLGVAAGHGLLTGGFAAVRRVTLLGWVSLTLVGTILAVCGSLLFILGARRTDAQVAAIASTLEPLVSILVGVLLLHEPMHLRTGIGCALILAAVVLLPIFTGKENAGAAEQ